MKKSTIILLIAVGILIIIGGLYLAYLFMCEDDWCYHYEWQRERREEKYNPHLAPAFNSNNLERDDSEINDVESVPVQNTRPVLSSLGVNIDYYNSQTKMAGDLIFTKDLLFDDGHISNDKVLLDFGSKDKYRINDIGSIEYWYYVPLKTKVRAPVDGKVQVVFFDHTQDWGVNFMQEGSSWIVSFEHIVNVVVKDGDIAKAGDIVGEAAPRNTYNKEIAMVELAVWKSGQQIIKYCPFNFLDRSLRPTFKDKIERVANEWEEFIGKDVYQQDKWVAPGCLVDSIVEK